MRLYLRTYRHQSIYGYRETPLYYLTLLVLSAREKVRWQNLLYKCTFFCLSFVLVLFLIRNLCSSHTCLWISHKKTNKCYSFQFHSKKYNNLFLMEKQKLSSPFLNPHEWSSGDKQWHLNSFNHKKSLFLIFFFR